MAFANCVLCAPGVKLCGVGITPDDCPGNELTGFLNANDRDSSYDPGHWCFVDYLECDECRISIFEHTTDPRHLRLYVPFKSWHSTLQCM